MKKDEMWEGKVDFFLPHIIINNKNNNQHHVYGVAFINNRIERALLIILHLFEGETHSFTFAFQSTIHSLVSKSKRRYYFTLSPSLFNLISFIHSFIYIHILTSVCKIVGVLMTHFIVERRKCHLLKEEKKIIIRVGILPFISHT